MYSPYRMIFFWADGTWCDAHELQDMLAWKSDDYGTLKLPEEIADERIDVIVHEKVS